MKSHLKGLTKTQIANLHKLAMYLMDEKNLKAGFDMSFYSNDGESCGTIGCAVGHGPYADIKKWRYEMFPHYRDRAFGIFFGSPSYKYLFTSRWNKYDNTAKGAARRIIRFLSSGVPEGFKEPSKEYVL